MEIKTYITNNFELKYKLTEYFININIANEFYRNKLYEKIKKMYLQLANDNQIYLNPNDEQKNEHILIELLTYFIYANLSNDDVIFSSTANNYNAINVKDYLIKINNNEGLYEKYEKVIYQIKQKIIKYYHKLKKFNEITSNINLYAIECIESENKINMILEVKQQLSNNDEYKHIYEKLKNYNVTIYVPMSNYIHLMKNFLIQNYNVYEITNEVLEKNNIDLNIINKYIYIIFFRYITLSGGSTQGSIIPSFKKILKKYLNIKIELFGSAINTSSTRYGSIFTDIEQYFGSIGSFFNLDIKAGYYEINPPFEYNLINNMFNKLFEWLENTNKGLLFFVIIPKINFKNMNGYIKLYKKYQLFWKFIKKEDFPYLHYNKDFSMTKVRNITNTNLLIFSNDHIKLVVKEIAINFNKYFDLWKSKKK
jgi:hypothetical protein